MAYVAWDIETCPLSADALPAAQQERLSSEVERLRERSPDENEDVLHRQAGSFHPHLGWICCISAVRGGPDGMEEPKSWTAASPEEEEALLDQFWADIHAIGRHHDRNREDLQWVTFNGKDFDVPFLTARTVANGLAPTRKDITNTYRTTTSRTRISWVSGPAQTTRWRGFVAFWASSRRRMTSTGQWLRS